MKCFSCRFRIAFMLSHALDIIYLCKLSYLPIMHTHILITTAKRDTSALRASSVALYHPNHPSSFIRFLIVAF
jgi:hypothetical protein